MITAVFAVDALIQRAQQRFEEYEDLIEAIELPDDLLAIRDRLLQSAVEHARLVGDAPVFERITNLRGDFGAVAAELRSSPPTSVDEMNKLRDKVLFTVRGPLVGIREEIEAMRLSAPRASR